MASSTAAAPASTARSAASVCRSAADRNSESGIMRAAGPHELPPPLHRAPLRDYPLHRRRCARSDRTVPAGTGAAAAHLGRRRRRLRPLQPRGAQMGGARRLRRPLQFLPRLLQQQPSRSRRPGVADRLPWGRQQFLRPPRRVVVRQSQDEAGRAARQRRHPPDRSSPLSLRRCSTWRTSARRCSATPRSRACAHSC